ncbi:MAG: glycerate kinase [Gemmatimonadaceae bacterium]
MAAAAYDAIARAGGITVAGGVIVSPTGGPSPHPDIHATAAEHPVPGRGSGRAASLVGDVASRVAGDDIVLVLLSGGATSLVAAPMPGVTADDLAALYESLLGSGLDIVAMNAVRKRFSRWGAGRLGAALSHARVHCLVVSDVPGDDLPSIGSGPCVGDPHTARAVAGIIADSRLAHRLPATIAGYLSAAVHGTVPETPKPGDAALMAIRSTIIVSNRLALAAGARASQACGVRAIVGDGPLVGDAATCGRALALRLRERGAGADGGEMTLFLWGGETTVTLGDAVGRGGRCQELALAAAEQLAIAESRPAGHAASPMLISMLAAGTDGRDGPTDAAGALVDTFTWSRIAAAGIDPARALSTHDAYPALEAAGALVKTGMTGTNVMDVVVGVVGTGRD